MYVYSVCSVPHTMESPKLSERVFHAGAHLLSHEDMSNEEVIRCITLWIQNTEV